ncbi:unnamed protein product [Porites lobata]|uniref:CHAT domain-containing protein n=1 Tax=Porites lobata TaxID=104759 RepID=A0ABN8PV70_9CNID|nr:unnamed protein product [Porites lobata]
MAERILQDIAEQKKRLAIAQINKNKEEKADAYYNLGIAYFSLKDFHRAIEYLKQYLSIAEEVGNRAGSAGRAYGYLGCAYDSLGDSQRAIEYHNQRLRIAKEVGNRAGEGCAFGNLGLAYHHLEDFQRAIEYHNQHLSIAKEEVGDRAAEGCGYGNLGTVYHSLKEFQRAIECHNQHLSIAKEVGDRVCQGKAYVKLGLANHKLYEIQRAIEYYNKYLIIAKEVGDRSWQCKGYINLGDIYHLLGQYERAIEYTNKCLIIAKEDGYREWEGDAYSDLGNIHQSLDEFPRAMECHKKHLNIAEEVGDRDGKRRAYVNIGLVHEALGDVPRAMENYKQSMSNAEETDDSFGQGRAYCRLGSCYRKLHDLKEAIECYKQHLSIAEEIGDRMSEASAHAGLGHSFLDSHSLNEALEHFRCCVKICDTIRANSISEDQLKIGFCRHHQCAYNHLWQILVMLQRNDEALYAAERGRAQALLDALKVTYGLTSLSPRSIESEEEVTYISKNTTVLTVFLSLELKILSMWVLRKEGNPVFRNAEFEIGGAHEDSFALLLDTALKKMRAGVGIRCENRSMDQLSDDPTSTIRDDDQTPQPSQETTDGLQPLYDAVIGPIEDLLDGDELIVVPDGALSKAPWAALSETLRIRTVPSLTSLKVITDSPIEYHSKSGALLVGDPCLKTITDKRGNPIYDPLKYARMEVEMIGEIQKSQTLTGEDATKEAVLQRIASVALVHIAAHGRKETGEIVLAPDPRWGSKTPTEEDYILKMSDIQAVKLRARLVVLSCCHSGQGPVSSEGVVGMARAFLFAGARSVLSTLWAIDDEATMMFMKSFYQQLESGESASVALQRATKCLRDSHDYSAPKYWAPFVLMGDDVKIELEKESLSKS